VRDVTINESSESGGPCISIPLKQRGTKDAAPPLGDIAEPFYFDSRGLVGVTLLISNEIPAPSFFFFCLFHRVIGDSRRQKTRGFPDSGEIKIRTGCLLFRASATRAIVLNSALFVLPEREEGGGGNVSPFAVADFGKRFGVEIVETRAQFQTDS